MNSQGTSFMENVTLLITRKFARSLQRDEYTFMYIGINDCPYNFDIKQNLLNEKRVNYL
jgi:hypothetical protein